MSKALGLVGISTRSLTATPDSIRSILAGPVSTNTQCQPFGSSAGESDRVVGAWGPGNAGGAKGPDFWCAFEDGEGRRHLVAMLETLELLVAAQFAAQQRQRVGMVSNLLIGEPARSNAFPAWSSPFVANGEDTAT